MEKNSSINSSSSPMSIKKNGKTRVGIYAALVIAFFGLVAIGIATAVMFFGLNASLLGIASSVDSQSDKIDQLSTDLMNVNDKVKEIETAPPVESLVPSSSLPSSSSSSSSAKKTGYEVTSIDSKWNLYTDYDLGFKIQIPKTVNIYDSNSNLIDTTVEFVRTKDSVRFFPKGRNDDDVVSWNIKIYDNATKKTVEQHFLDLDSECDVVVYEDVDGSDYQYARAESSDKSENTLGFPKCFLNYAAGSFYSEKDQKFAYWPIGQDARFYLNSEALDGEMEDSFEFID